jgi:hypothetical protein
MLISIDESKKLKTKKGQFKKSDLYINFFI